MKKLILHTILVLSLSGFGMGIATAQDISLSVDKRKTSFTANSNADYYEWFINGVLQSGHNSNVFNHEFVPGNYLLSAVPYLAGCSGDEFVVDLTVKPDVTVGDTQVIITSPGPVIACAPSDIVNAGTIVQVDVALLKYILTEGEEYAIRYVINDGNKVDVSLQHAFDGFGVETKNLPPGNHVLKIVRLFYGAGFRQQVDYSDAENPPSIIISIKPKIEIGEIGFE